MLDTNWIYGPHILTNTQLERLNSLLKKSEQGLVLIGAMKTRSEQQAALKIIERLGWRAMADVTSGLRFLKYPLLDHSREFSELKADCVLQLGGRLILKPLLQWLESRRGQTHIYVDAYLENHNPGLTTTHRIQCDLEWLSGKIEIGYPGLDSRFRENDKIAEASFNPEAFVARHISKTNWQSRVLFLGTSLPIRYMDRFAAAGDSMPLVVANRGASGIDGIVSTAAGFAFGIGEPLVLVLGDMTFLHDINGLAFFKKIPIPIIAVVINNHGNGIFSTLPIANSAEIHQRYFEVPHEYDLAGAAQIFGIQHQRAHTTQEFEIAYANALGSKESIILEFLISPKSTQRS